jgi:DnaJ-domain-containing protein 1
MSDNKYKNGKIYTIRCRTDDSLIYVGSTTETRLSARFGKHKHQNTYLNQYIKQTNGNWIDWYIELHEEFSCENKEQLNKKEGEIIREIGTLNKCIAGRTDKEYREDYKEKIKKYREDNQEIIKEYRKEYSEINKEKIKEYMKEYSKVNKERKKEYDKNYREKISGKIVCSCGCIISRKGMREHERTKKHLSYIEEK